MTGLSPRLSGKSGSANPARCAAQRGKIYSQVFGNLRKDCFCHSLANPLQEAAAGRLLLASEVHRSAKQYLIRIDCTDDIGNSANQPVRRFVNYSQCQRVFLKTRLVNIEGSQLIASVLFAIGQPMVEKTSLGLNL